MSEMFEFKGKNNPKIKSDSDDTILKFYYSAKDLADYETHHKFLNCVKYMVRKDPRYDNYKKSLYDLGLGRCQIHSGINSDMAPIEMHHGPIFDLFTICMIVTDQMLAEDEQLTTFMVADRVLKEHEKNNIQLVMLCETCHEAAENDSHFLPFEMGFGHIDRFLTRNKKGFTKEQKKLLQEYIKNSREHGYVDNGIFEIFDKVKKYIKKYD